MADANMQSFEQRVGRINKRRSKISRGIVENVVNKDGLIETRVRRHGPRFPWRGLFLSCLVFFALKGLLLAHLGQGTYDSRVEKLKAGTVFEQVGGWAMHADPITQYSSDLIRTYIR